MAPVKGFRGACFINTDIRRTDSASSNSSRWAWRAKAALLVAYVPLVYALLDDPGSTRGALVLACTAVFVLRVLAQGGDSVGIFGPKLGPYIWAYSEPDMPF